jgi:hypothetical protein
MEKPVKQDSEEAQYRKLTNFLTLNTGTVLKWRDALLIIQENEWYRFDGLNSMEAYAKKYLPNLKTDTIRKALWREKRKRLKAPTKDVGQGDNVTSITTVTTSTSGNGEVKQKNDDILLDPTGRKIPKELLPLLACQPQLDLTARQVSALGKKIEELRVQRCAPFDQLPNDIAKRFDYLAFIVRDQKRTYLCPWCQGRCRILKKECPNCDSLGLITKGYYEQNTPTEMKHEFARLSTSVS